MPIPKVTSAALLSAINSGAIRGIAKTAKPLGSIHLYRSSLEGYRFGRGRQNRAVFYRRIRKRRSNRRSQNQLRQIAAVCRRRWEVIW